MHFCSYIGYWQSTVIRPDTVRKGRDDGQAIPVCFLSHFITLSFNWQEWERSYELLWCFFCVFCFLFFSRMGVTVVQLVNIWHFISISLAHDRTNSKWLFSSQMLLLSSCWLSAPGQSLSCSYWFLPVGVGRPNQKKQLQNHGEIAADQVCNNNNGVCMKHCESLTCSSCSLWPSNVVLIK